MKPLAIATVAAIFAALYFGRREAEYDRDGNPEVRPVGATFVCLVVATSFACETIAHIQDPFYKRHPENLYVLIGFAVFSLLAAWLLRFTRVTMASGKVVEHMPFICHKELAISDLVELENAGKVTSLRFADGQSIGLVHMFSGVPGFVQALHREAPHLRDRADEA